MYKRKRKERMKALNRNHFDFEKEKTREMYRSGEKWGGRLNAGEICVYK